MKMSHAFRSSTCTEGSVVALSDAPTANARRSVAIASLTLALASLSILGCGSGGGGGSVTADAAPDLPGQAVGSEGAPCYRNGTCNLGLTCASKLCVRAPGNRDLAAQPDLGTREAGPRDA